MKTRLRALTLWQPWASAILDGVKPWENRPWAPRQLRSMEPEPLWLALHAGLTIDRGLDRRVPRHRLRTYWAELAELWPGRDCRRKADWPRGVLLGLVRFDHAVRHVEGAESWGDPWAVGPWCWHVDEVLALEEPIPCRGAQGLWYVPEEHVVVFRELYRSRRAA